jgi:hypothetical protein
MKTYTFYTIDKNYKNTIHFEVKCIEPKRTNAYKTLLQLLKTTEVKGIGYKLSNNK